MSLRKLQTKIQFSYFIVIARLRECASVTLIADVEVCGLVLQLNGVMTNTGHSVIFYTGPWDEESDGESGGGGGGGEGTLPFSHTMSCLARPWRAAVPGG